MKKLIVFLVTLQMIIISVYGLVLLRGYAISSLINENTSSIMLVFNDLEEYQLFIDLAENEGVTITMPIFVDDTNVIIYTSDFSLGGRIELRRGRWPDDNSNEFISAINTGEPSQVGLIHSITPGFNLSISGIKNITNRELAGIYLINSNDIEFLERFVNELNENIYRAELFSINNEVDIFNQITIIQLIELIAISMLLFICILATFINYSVSKLKLGSVLIIHGYSKFYIVKKLALELLTLLLLAFIISFVLILTYIYLAGYIYFVGIISLFVILIYTFLFLVYMIFSNVFILIYLALVKTTSILKGKKPYFVLQFANYTSKIAFLVAIFIFGSLAINNYIQLNYRLNALSDWEMAKNIYSTRVYSVGQSTDLAIDLDIMTRKLDFYSSMERENNAFIMDSRNILFYDMGAMPYQDMDSAPPMELSPHGFRVTISPNFLNFNPIIAVNGVPILEQVIYNPYVLNILVPEKFKPYEEEILSLYLEYFHYSSVTIDNIYNYDLGFELNNTPIEMFNINIIYVENNQDYFSFNERVRPENGNNIRDPIAVLYTGSVHPSRLSSTMSGNFFFYTESIDAHSAILPLLLESGLSHVIRSTVSVFDENGKEIVELREQIIRIATLSLVLVISSLTIVYSLMLNYFEKNKKMIFIKFIMGYSFINRHFKFILIISLFNIGLMFIFSLLLGYQVFILGIILGVLDILFIFLIDKKLTLESFTDIMKGKC